VGWAVRGVNGGSETGSTKRAEDIFNEILFAWQSRYKQAMCGAWSRKMGEIRKYLSNLGRSYKRDKAQ